MMNRPLVRVLSALLLAGLAAFAPMARAQTAATPASFNGGTGANDFVYHVALQSDGRILIGGRFTTYNDVARSGVARLNADGSLDASFEPGSGTTGSVYYVTELANGQILVTGDFTAYDGVARAGVARLNADGTLDATFDPGTGAEGGVVFGLDVQVDGKYIVGGRFTTFAGVSRPGVARLNADGTLDTAFDPGTGVVTGSDASRGVYVVVLQPDGRVLLGGFFNSYNGVLQPGIVRVNTDGSLDTSFVTGDGVGRNNTVQTIALQPDGGIIVGGNFTRFSDVAEGGLVRLTTSGAIDTTFNPGTGASARTDVVYAAALQANGQIVVGGDFAAFNGVTAQGIVRLNADGSVDTTFATTGVTNSYVDTVAIQPDGGVLVGGNFTTVGSASSPGVTRLDPDGGNESADVVSVTQDVKRIGVGQSSNVATVTLTRTGNLAAALTVSFTASGSAVSGVDYAPLSLTHKFRPNHATATFEVIAETQAGEEFTTPLKLVLAPGTGYTVGSPDFVKVRIAH